MKLRNLIVGSGALLAICGAALVSPAQADWRPAACSNATLKGTYLFAFYAWIIGEQGRQPTAAAGQEVYDGEGKGTGVNSLSINGVISRLVPYTFTYTVNADCTGVSTVDTDGAITHYDIFVAPSGEEFVFLQTDTGNVAAGTEPRVKRRVH